MAEHVLIDGLSKREQWSNGFYGSYMGHSITVERDHPSRDWYIIVILADGRVAYDGWWKKTATLPEAITQAIKGSGLRAS